MFSHLYYNAKYVPDELLQQDIKIYYPAYWFAPVKLSPFAHTIEEETIAWMNRIGLIKNKNCLQHVRAMEPRHYAGYTHSMAAYDHALAYCQYITMWLLWDDECVEQSVFYNREIELPLLALAGESIPKKYQQDRYVIAFADIGDAYEKVGASTSWRIRFAEKMMEWAKKAIDEESARRLLLDKSSRSFSDALQLRSFTVGIRPNTLPLERAVGIEIPPAIHEDSEYELLLDQAAKICCIVNDLVGVSKDIKNNQNLSNLILYHQSCYQCSLIESYQAVINIHDAAVKQYDSLAESLLNKTNDIFHERLATFFSHLRYMDSGFGFWHQDCIRYQDTVASDGKHFFTLSIQTENKQKHKKYPVLV